MINSRKAPRWAEGAMSIFAVFAAVMALWSSNHGEAQDATASSLNGPRGIVSAIVDNGQLWLTYNDNPTPTNVGAVMGPMGPAGPVATTSLGTVNISQNAVVAINAGVRAVSVNVPGALMNDSLVVFPASNLPAGYSIENAFVTAPGVVSITLTAPLLAIGASYTIPVKVIAVGR